MKAVIATGYGPPEHYEMADVPVPRPGPGQIQVRVAAADPAWSAYWRIDPRPDGRPAPDGPVIDALEDKFELVASGEAVAISAGHNLRALRPDLTSIPLDGVDPAHVVLATRANDRSRLVAAFRKYAQAHLTGPEPVPAEPADS
ncbi:hypothetical protein NE236_18135 [Actinoallomurus purpureus]|uniref:hypothetical protein n=1 Tax=Actinoallomurus purpureus TaxID=478114 RepID=UPI002092680B|nr:hypothetical protein [Actinoallomurus purpureus]MCO6006909.1 hypothetical protein [Actinoallomurus purpureus]